MKSVLCFVLLAVSTAFAGVIWHDHQNIAIYESVNYGSSGSKIISGDGFNYDNAARISVWPTQGTGKALWSYPLLDPVVAGARTADVFAALQFDDSVSMSTIFAFTSTSHTPLWNHTIMAFSGVPDGQYQMEFSDDGKTLVVGLSIQRNGNYTAQVLKFTNVLTASPSIDIINVATAQNAFIRDVQISSDGTLVAVQLGAGFAVVDLTKNSVRYPPSQFGFDSNTLCMSTDGEYIAYGFTTLDVVRWTGKTYVSLANYSLSVNPSTIATACAFSGTTGYLASAWSNFNYGQKYAALHKATASSLTQQYVYTFPPAQGTDQDLPAALTFSRMGEAFVMGSWGDGHNSSTVALFTPKKTAPVYTFVTPGSVVDVDLYVVQGKTAYFTACGKAVHNNVMGDGGDLYSFSFPLA